MGKSIEYKIRFKAVLICAVVAIGVTATIIYFYGLRRNIAVQRTEIAHRRDLLSAANKLIFRVSEAQSFSSLYLTLKNNASLAGYTRSLDSVGMLIDTIVAHWPDEAERLRRIEGLLREQARNIATLNREFAGRNPVTPISKRIQEYEPPQPADTLHIVNIRQDTVYSEPPRKGFFKRLKEVFKPDKAPVQVAVDQRTDTIRTTVNDSLAIVREVGDIAEKAKDQYDRNIRMIEKRVGRLIATDKEIAAEISALLMEFHENTLDSTLALIAQSERDIDRNYVWSTVGGVVALLLILTFITLIITDINKGARARHELEIANKRIRQVMESRHRLLLSVSHDIKTPLNSILGYLGQMENDPTVKSMRNSSEHILAMLENLLEFSSLEQGAQQKSESDFGLQELCAEIYEMFLPLAQRKGLGFSFEAENVRIHADRIKLKQIIVNLLSNGVKYTASGSVGFTAGFDGKELKIEVYDTGAGIPADKLPQLFRPFVRIEQNNRLAEGTGFGMFVVKGLTELLGGRVTVDSEVGTGTTVRVTIPAARASREIPQGTKRIRLYDDDPVIVRMLTDMLTTLGHRVTESDCDLILTDMEMGDTSGLDILREAGGIPVVVMTGRGDYTAAKAREAGFDGFLAKPVSTEALREVIGSGDRPHDPADDLLGGSREEIVALFRTATEENFGLLQQALANGDYPRAQALCHKMFPMFAQLGYPADDLRRMDMHRKGPYEGWQEDVKRILGIRV